MYIKGFQVRISTLRFVLDPEFVFFLANSADPDEMLLNAAFHLGLLLFAKLPAYSILRVN